MINGSNILARPLRWAMVGGGEHSQIGYIHRSAALRDRNFELVAAALDIDPERGRAFGQRLGIDPARCYPDYLSLFELEAQRPDGIEAVSIATPNGTHYAITRAALEAGLHVVCEKPLCFTLDEAEALRDLAKAKGRIVGLTYGYAGHQLIEQARAMIVAHELGEIRMVHMQFAHGFHSAPVEAQNQATQWRVDPRQAGPSYVLGDVGTHPLYLSKVMLPEFRIKRLMCSRQSFVASRAPLEDNAYTLMEYESGAMGMVWSSAVNAGSMHGQKIRVIGSRASLEWWDERPNQLSFEIQGQPAQTLERGMGYLHPDALQDDRIGGGHPEGLFEGWSNLYRRFALAMDAANRGDTETLAALRYPDIDAGVDGVRWVERCVESANNDSTWIAY
ncbi:MULTISPECIES: Gfo/Idh/MocA family protein [Pseudomonas]|jgi:predicted dehydrogenase|uniref:Oxidoreductase n=1 Tax=Pseudomonas frederiksbergensis TaxID=104087 RepID=A0A0B1Z5X4_9PSED|nr:MULTISPECIES: Gfo/Idh/MocA family oxidoreductase [Pseudomonas]KHK64748.1 oxidoreductase [Pseudomonas frederiksbergensis]KJH86401.1 oxidoreductase [Pseudomonas fluorescens]MBI6619672.1 Gfo/Idh/MocA family oxidoreductase [Pseudomonas corrugata]MBI6690678.1 Gfo/Idh/MocA family oxidoreductase [Pseudomonas corrugata]WRV70645.1 Gfo/Idh/MocA family oxidoreductase [Pseudomonas frederiksbergensis]